MNLARRPQASRKHRHSYLGMAKGNYCEPARLAA